MAISVVMPALEMAQETGRLLSWRKKEGEKVTKGEPLLEIETDKAVVEIEAPGDGILAGVTAHEGAEIPVGQTIAWLLLPGESPPAQAASPAQSARATGLAGRATETASVTSEPAAAAGPRTSPKARRLAKELGIDLSCLRGTGPEGTITAEDVQSAAKSKEFGAGPVSAAVSQVHPLSQVARLMAERTTQSWTSVPHFFVVREVDCTDLLSALKNLAPEIEHTHNVRLTITDLLVALVARVLAKHPHVNASWTREGIRLHEDINISVAMAVSDGVVAAVIHHANTADLGEIAAQRRDLSERARANRLRPADILGGTFTISNLGMYQVDAFSAIITPQQAATLAVGSIVDRVVPVDGKPGIRPMVVLTLSSDHRVIHGARAAEFMNDVAEALRKPQERLG